MVERWDRIGRAAAYGAALALTPYLLIKVSWVLGSLLGLAPIGDGFSLPVWVVLNLVTIGMAGIGIALGLALVRPWGMRIPGWLVAFVAWVGSGFLVSLLPYAVLTSVIGAASADAGGSDDPAMPVWEAVLIEFSFLGMACGLALALPAYLRRRWPEAFTGRVGDGARTGLPWPAVLAATVGAVWLYWSVGGTLGISHPGERTADGYALTGLGGFWALAGAAALWTLTRGRPARLPRWVPLTLGWLGSGSLFAWSAWKLPFTLVLALAEPAEVTLPENLVLAATLHAAATLAGATMLLKLISLRPTTPPVPRSRAADDEGMGAECRWG